VSIMFSFVLDMWYCRNDKEHEKDLNESTTVKARLLAKIDWIKSTVTRQELRHYKYLDIAQLAKTPIYNLVMLAEQLCTLKKIRQPSSCTVGEEAALDKEE
jgi:hypothetical protein